MDSKYAVVVCGGSSSKGYVLHLQTLELYKVLDEHKKAGVWFMAPTSDGLYIITRNFSDESIIWSAKTFECILFIEEKFIMLTSDHRICRGFLHDGFFKVWSAKTAA